MAIAFSRTTRSLVADDARHAWLIWLLILLLLALWLGWLFFAPIQIYAASAHALLQVEGAAQPVSSSIAGQVLRTDLKLGRRVAAGEVLAELDARNERLRLDEEKAHLAARPAQIAALEREIAAQGQASDRAREAAGTAAREAHARHAEAVSAAKFAEESFRRLKGLGDKGRLSEIEVLRARAEADKSRSAADALGLEAARLETEAQGRTQLTRADIESRRREIAMLEGEMASISATIARLEQDIDRHLIRAPTDGVIGDVAPVEAGGFVTEGQVLGRIVPTGDLKIVADFPPTSVLGRVRPGQGAELRLDGFPWTQYGSVRARVIGVGSEIRDGRVRIDLLPEVPTGSAIPLQHGLPGTVEVAIERTTPAQLVLRAAGQVLARPASVESTTQGRAE